MMGPVQGHQEGDEGTGAAVEGTAAELRASVEGERVVRELHDLVAHGVSEIVVQAAAQRHALRGEDSAARRALESIERRGRELLTEMRRLAGDGTYGAPELAPSPGLSDLPRLVSRMRKAGLDIELRMVGEPVAPGPGIEISTYRLVEEGLAAVGAVSDLRAARVGVRYGTDELELEIAAPGGDQVEADGREIAAMSKRAKLLGGSLDAGRRNGRYAIRARFPLARP